MEDNKSRSQSGKIMMQPQMKIWEFPFLIIPILSFFDGKYIYHNTPFLAIVLSLIIYYFGYSMQPLRKDWPEIIRIVLVLITGGWLTIILIGEIEVIISEVYQLEFCWEVSFFMKIILILANAEIGIEMCKRKREPNLHPL